MRNLRIQWVLLRCIITSVLVAAPLGCATVTEGSNAQGNLSVPQIVAPPDKVPEELQPYVPRFEEILEYWGFRVGSTTDPQAFQIKLEYSGVAKQAKVVVYLIQNNRPVLTASATPNSTAPWHWFSNPPKDALVDELANNAINQFDTQLGKFVQQVQIVKAPGAVTAETAPPVESGYRAYGTAFAINSPNTYLTAHHVIAGATEITLYCSHDKAGPATVVSNDVGNDIAVLHSDMKADAFLELAPNDSLAPGDHVFTVGYPAWTILGASPKYTDGAVSSLSGFGDSKSIMQITVPIQPGNSGGPLVDSQGRVVGVITSTAALPYFYRHTGTLPQNINYAVPSYYVFPLVKDITQADAGSMSKMTAINRVTDSVCLVAVRVGSRSK